MGRKKSPRRKISTGALPEPGRRHSALFLAAGLALFGGAVVVHLQRDPFFLNLVTGPWAGHLLAADAPDPGARLWGCFLSLFKVFASGYLLPVYGLLLPALFLAARGASRWGERAWASLLRLSAHPRFPVALFVLALGTGLAVRALVIGNLPPVGDEFTYAFQADLLASGRLCAAPPPVGDPFAAWSVIHAPYWHSKVTLGWPLLLAPGWAVGLETLVSPLLAAGAVYLLFRLGRRLLGPEGGLLASAAALGSPLFLLHAGTLFPHCAAAFFALLLLDALLAIPGSPTARPAWLAGLAAGALALIRPAEALVLLAGGLPLAIQGLARSPSKGQALGRYALALVLAGVGVGLLLAVNLIQNGNPWLFGYTRYDPSDRWGFGVMGHSSATALWNTVFCWLRNAFWTVPFTVALAGLALFRRESRLTLLLVPAALLTTFYAGFYTLGAFELGARYHLTAFVLLLTPAAGGLLWLRDRLSSRMTWAKALPFVWLAGVGLFVAGAVCPILFPAVRAQYARRADLARWVSNPPEIPGRSVIFLKGPADLANIFLTRNFADLERPKNLVVLYLTPQVNQAVLQAFPDRSPWTIQYDPALKRFLVWDGVDLSATAENYLAAGLNYAAFDRNKALETFHQALARGPCSPGAVLYIARLHETQGQAVQALGLYRSLDGVLGARWEARCGVGRCLNALGRREEAIRAYQSAAAVAPGSPQAAAAVAWAQRLQTENR